MSSQGALPAWGGPDFGLIETFRWSPAEGTVLLDEHMLRLGRSAAALGFAFEREAVLRRLADFVAPGSAAPRRVRLVLARDGSCEISAAPLDAPAALWRVAVAAERFASGDPWLRHKTTRRARYEEPLAAAAGTADEVLFLNERDELCEGARTNLFVERDGLLLTPPLACGLLPGTLRAHLLREGRAREAVLGLADLAGPARWFMGNAVRGLVPGLVIT